MSTHTPDPWIAIIPGMRSGLMPVFADEQAAREWLDSEPTGGNVEIMILPVSRIVACTDACADVSDNELSHGPVIALQRYSTLANERDELRKSFSHLIEICRVKCGPNDEPILPGVSNHQALVDAVEVLERSKVSA